MNSREKVLALRQRVRELAPTDEESARALQALLALLPLFQRLLPQDPAELDRYLRTVACMAARCRSDDAPVVRVYEWRGDRWEAIEMGEVGEP